jgi:uracil-DNA glycosylase
MECFGSLPPPIHEGWRAVLAEEPCRKALSAVDSLLAQEAKEGNQVFPPRSEVFRSLNDLAPEAVRVVILGQDPYHGAGQALGRSFAVPNEFWPKPPSLVNLFKEVASDLGVPMDRSRSDLSGWASQGVLLLNTVLTVRASEPLSHRGRGWEPLTDRILAHLASLPQPIVFLLWGAEARAKRGLIEGPAAGEPKRRLILEAPHPSPLSAHRGFLGCRHFSRANGFLAQPIHWERTSLA